jgi:hypothetical protein
MNTSNPTVSALKGVLHVLAKNDLLWSAVWKPLAKFGRHMTWQRFVAEFNRIESSLRPDYEVQAGPFKGMRYPQFKAKGSTMLGKLLGTYEAELGDIIELLLKQPYEMLVDVGCAEGFYAVGMAMRLPQAKIFAFDIDEEAQQLCTAMAKLNKVEDRITIGGVCSGPKMIELSQGKRSLIIADCEGAELDLFDESTIQGLAQCDLLIEVHDFIHRGVSLKLQDRFSATHDCRVVHSLEPATRAQLFPSPLVKETHPEILNWIYSEGRPEVMDWLYLTPRQAGK